MRLFIEKRMNALPKRARNAKFLLSLLLGAASAGLAAQPVLAAQSQSYAVAWVTAAMSSQDGDCPGGINPDARGFTIKALANLGYPGNRIEKLMEQMDGGTLKAPPPGEESVRDLMLYRSRINGKPANAYAHPAGVADDHMNTVAGKYAYGFNLDGKGKASPNSFEDPATHEAGINNELFRVLGCIQTMRGSYTQPSTWWYFRWGTLRATAPAWLMTLSGGDLSADGDISITFDRAIEHLEINGSGGARSHVTYRIDPDPRSHHVFGGRIKDHVISITEPGHLLLLLDPLSTPEFEMFNTHLRLSMKPDGSLDGFLGGYENWQQLYFALSLGGQDSENSEGLDIPSIYHLLRSHADGMQDPKTGMNMAISATYRTELVPVFTVDPGRTSGQPGSALGKQATAR